MLLVSKATQAEFGFEFVVLAGEEAPTPDEDVVALEAIVNTVGLPAMAQVEDSNGDFVYYVVRPGQAVLPVELDARALDRGEWVLTPESLAKAAAT